MTSEWQNYDFGANWSKVSPYLRTRTASKLFKLAHKLWVEDGQLNPSSKYDDKKAPSSLFYYSDAYDHFYHSTIWKEELKDRKSIVPIQWWKQMDKIQEEIVMSGDFPDSFVLLQSKIMKRLGWDFESNSDHLFHYVPFGTCHFWNPCVSLYLAQKLLPEHKWIIVKGDKHTTVISVAKKLVFDIVYFAIDGRLQDHTFKRKYTMNDPSLGGIQAVEGSGYLQGECWTFSSADELFKWCDAIEDAITE